MAHHLSNRYQTIRKLGQGGMGTVYLVYDRLNQIEVALKSININGTNEVASSYMNTIPDDTLIPIAHEFQLLGSIKHPHIISVLDYGFDAQSFPFFTMDYLEDAKPVNEFAADLSLEEKVKLIQDILQALVYIHRRDILHRDLKPGNILVADGVLKVLDFGLASVMQQDSKAVGTLEFMAPELITGGSATVASDLYAVGVIAYELLEGHTPFNAKSSDFFHNLIHQAPRFDQIELYPPLRKIIERLLHKDPLERPPNAEGVLNGLNDAMGWEAPEESATIRESFLQAAKFVGREKELKTITDLIRNGKSGLGGTFLIGGESGVGKSRLLDELRIFAMVQGCMVLNGQSVEEDRSPLTIWKEPLKRLIIEVAPSPIALSVLHTIIPEIQSYFEKPIPPPDDLPEDLALKRLKNAIFNQFLAVKRPIVLFLEDLHWEYHNFELLNYAIQHFSLQPVVIIATYRNDEAPELPLELPDMHSLLLGRLEPTDIAELGRAILGDLGSKPEIQALIQEESEGNAFFLVEILREMAQISGHLGSIQATQETEKLIPKGIQSIVSRRLDKLPNRFHDLLFTTALVGREIDLDLLKILSAGLIDLNRFLAACGDAAILEFYDNHWRFSHNKIRENLSVIQADESLIVKHTQIAQGLATLYGDRKDLAVRIVRHYHLAQNREMERVYTLKAVDYARETWQNELAIDYLTRSIELTEPNEYLERYRIYQKREAVYNLIGKRTEQAQDLVNMDEIAARVASQGGIDLRAEARLSRAAYAVEIGSHTDAIEDGQTGIAIAAENHDRYLQAKGHYLTGNAFVQLGEWTKGDHHLNQALKHLENHHDDQLKAQTYKMLGVSQVSQGNLSEGADHYHAALDICVSKGHRHEEAKTLVSLGNLAELKKTYAEAEAYFSRASTIFAETGDQLGRARLLTNLCNISMSYADYDKAINYANTALHVSIFINSEFLKLLSILNLMLINSFIKNDTDRDLYRYLAEAYVQDLSNPFLEAIGLSDIAYTYLAEQNYPKAKSLYDAAFAIAQSQDLGSIESEIRIGLTKYFLDLGDSMTAIGYLKPVLDAYEADPEYLNGLVRSFFVYQVVYEALLPTDPKQAKTLLTECQDELEKSILVITDPNLRKIYVETSPGVLFLLQKTDRIDYSYII